jgi:hypothetical protein
MSTSRKRPHTLTLAPQHRRHPRYVRPPPRSPYPWRWACHRCGSFYRFSAALNRCLACSHRFCRKCISEYDYDGWDRWKAYWAPMPGTEATSGGGEYDESESCGDPRYWTREAERRRGEEEWDVEWLAWSESSPEDDDEEGESFAATRSGDGRLWFHRAGDEDGGVKLPIDEESTPTSAPRQLLLFSSFATPSEDEEESPIFSPDCDGRMSLAPRHLNIEAVTRESKLLPALDLATPAYHRGVCVDEEMVDIPLLENEEESDYGICETPGGRWPWWRSAVGDRE